MDTLFTLSLLAAGVVSLLGYVRYQQKQQEKANQEAIQDLADRMHTHSSLIARFVALENATRYFSYRRFSQCMASLASLRAIFHKHPQAQWEKIFSFRRFRLLQPLYAHPRLYTDHSGYREQQNKRAIQKLL